MKKLKLIYNPNAGDKSFKNKLDSCIRVLQEGGFDVSIFRSVQKGSIEEHIAGLQDENIDTIVTCGGDGTINMTINAIMENKLNVKLGIIPSGTANDYASFLGMPKEPEEACRIIAKGNTLKSDIGIVNGKYFVNVCGAGLLTNISQNIDENFKNTLGKLAYYIKGIEQVQNFVPMPVRVTNSKEVIEENVYLILVLNSAGAGSFDRLAPKASIYDGVFDFIAFKSVPIKDIALLFLKIFKGDYLDDPNIIYFQDNYIKIESTAEETNELFLETDIDGERGPDMPVEIRNIPAAIEVYYNKDKDI